MILTTHCCIVTHGENMLVSFVSLRPENIRMKPGAYFLDQLKLPNGTTC